MIPHAAIQRVPIFDPAFGVQFPHILPPIPFPEPGPVFLKSVGGKVEKCRHFIGCFMGNGGFHSFAFCHIILPRFDACISIPSCAF